MKILFLDAEFTGVHARTTLVSLALVTLDGKACYLELDDYDRAQVSPWLRENVLNLLDPGQAVNSTEAFRRVSAFLEAYSAGDPVSLVSAGLGPDLTLFYDLFRHGQLDGRFFNAVNDLPLCLRRGRAVDLNTLLALAGFDPARDREEFTPRRPEGQRHNALYDARLVRECFLELMALPEFHRLSSLLEELRV